MECLKNMEDPLFDGQSLKNICNNLEIYQV